MFTAIEPIYRRLCEIFQARFAKDAYTHENADKPDFPDGENLFKALDIGLRTLNKKNVTPDIIPYAALEWGATSDVQPFRMPESYKYYLTIPLVLITGFGTMTDAQMHLVFRPISAEGDPRDIHLNEGIGELVSEVGSFFWQQYHTGRFSFEDSDSFPTFIGKKSSGWSWDVIDFTQLIHNPYLVSSTVDTPLL